MKTPTVSFLLTLFLLTSCADTPKPKPAWPAPTYYLPSRPPTGNHGQGQAPPIDCPRQYREIVALDDGKAVLLYCWGKAVTT